jgi:hypothetical protein
MMELPKARVFISCGQRNSKEKDIGLACKDYLDGKGFETYFAEEVHSLEALTENIFRHLRISEYFVFIDFRREELHNGKFRGSLFVNQEIAIAALLGIETVGFHEEGVIREGVVEHLIVNPFYLKDKEDFLKKLKENTEKWHNDWRNELSLEFPGEDEGVARNFKNPDNTYADWYHLQVHNNHRNRYARNCVAYILEIKNIDTGKEITPGNFELVWAGTGLFQRHILPKRAAEVDAFLIVRGRNVIEFNCRPSTSSQYGMPSLGKGNYLMTYLIASENFETVMRTFRLEFGGDFSQIKFSNYS